MDKDTLYKLYILERKSLKGVADEAGVTATTIQRWLRQHGIPTRTRSEARRVAKKHAYSEETLEAMRTRAATARARITQESRARQREKMKGRSPHNKGKTWTEEERAAHMASRASDEYREKLAASKRGPKSHLWKGGKTPDSSLHGWEWRKRRQEVYERDSWICADCGCHCLNTKDSKANPHRKIQAHHIVPRRYGGSDEMENLVTLCMSCHHKRERNLKLEMFERSE